MKSAISTAKCRDDDELFKTLSEELPVGVCIMQDGRFCYVNSTFPIAIGYTVDELVGKDSLEIVVPEDREMMKENTMKMLKEELRSPYQFRVTCKDGSIVWVMATVKSIQYHGKRATLGNYMEITERKLMEETLKENEERYRELADSITDVFFAMDERLRYTYWNRASEILTGIRANDAIGKSLPEIFPDRPWRRRMEKAYRNVLRTQQPRTFVNDYDIDGRHYVFEISAYPSRGGISVFVKDITEHKQAEDALREAEEEKSALLKEAPVDIVHTDLKGKIIYVNQRFESESGYSQGEVIGKSGFQLDWFPAGTLEFLAERLAARLGGSPAKHWETQFKCKDGRWIWIELEGKILRRSGVPVGFQIIATNITERKQAEEALRRSEERYRTILEEMEDSYFEVDLGGHFTFVNNSVYRNLGYSKKELIGMSYKNFTAEEDIEPVFRVFNEVYQTGTPNKGFPWKVVRKEGIPGFAEASVSLLRDDKGEIIGFRGVGRDITERKRMEDALQQSEEKYRALFDSSVIGTIVLDAKTMKIVMANQAAAKILDLGSLEQGIGLNPVDFIAPEDKDRILSVIVKEMFEKDLRRTNEFRAVTKNGREIWISATGARIKHEGRATGLISFTDITEQKRQNERLMMTDRLASIGELAAGAAHELNNPLAGIIGLSELLMEKGTPDYIRKDLAMIRDEARRAANVTSNLLTFARKHRPVKQLTQINAIIENVLELRAYAHKSNCIEVERHLAPDLPEIPLDHFQMQQVFLNIIINAEYFMIQAHNRGTLTITTRRQNGSVVVSFADNGPGIPQENLGRVFDPFFTTKEAGKGTGLGLSICHGIVAEHGGQIYATSQPGKGATIFVELPINGNNRVEVTL
ncbi:MAG: PAS domain S-box protein [Dehalococcoidia bacterium]|nr:PAS domain S-box protein [Dehalococcoidia bacterium]MDH4291626.1 PAS domain S-box protein [Dehalococcoidia bacterium]